MKKKKKFLFDVSVKFNINANYYIFKKYSSLNKINGCNKIKKNFYKSTFLSSILRNKIVRRQKNNNIYL